MQDILVPVICNFVVHPPVVPFSLLVWSKLLRSLDWRKVLYTRSIWRPHRPVSNLCFISKVVECIIASMFVRHAKDNKLFPARQSLYLWGYSTETAMLCLYNDVVWAVGNKPVIAFALFGFWHCQPLDNVNHSWMVFGPLRVCDWFGSLLVWRYSHLFHWCVVKFDTDTCCGVL